MYKNNIKKIRKQRGITLQQIADKARLSTTYINDMERFLSEPTISKAYRIANAFDLSVQEVFPPE